MKTFNVLDVVKQCLKDSGPASWEEISKKTGVPASFMRKVAYGDRVNPRIEGMQKLMDYFGAPKRKTPAKEVA